LAVPLVVWLVVLSVMGCSVAKNGRAAAAVGKTSAASNPRQVLVSVDDSTVICQIPRGRRASGAQVTQGCGKNEAMEEIRDPHPTHPWLQYLQLGTETFQRQISDQP